MLIFLPIALPLMFSSSKNPHHDGDDDVSALDKLLETECGSWQFGFKGLPVVRYVTFLKSQTADSTFACVWVHRFYKVA